MFFTPKALVVLTGVLLGTIGHAQEKPSVFSNWRNLEIDAVVPNPSASASPGTPLPPPGYIVAMPDMISAVTLFWNVIKDNRPVLNTDLPGADAVPVPAAADWTAMSGWKPMTRIAYHYGYKNRVGVEAVKLDYELQFVSGGQYLGKGKYLTDLRVIALNTLADWGYRLSVKAASGKPVNVGTPSDPIAAIPLQLNIEVSHPLKDFQTTEQFLVRGDGSVEHLRNAKRAIR